LPTRWSLHAWREQTPQELEFSSSSSLHHRPLQEKPKSKIMGPTVPRDDTKIHGTIKVKVDTIIASILHGNNTAVKYEDLVEICVRARELFLSEHVLLKLSPPFYVFGDIHGQLEDLKFMLNKIGAPPHHRMLFLGDYVDRGQYSIPTIILLIAIKLRYPDQIYLLRGNHETRLVNRRYGFFDECLAKYGVDQGLQAWTHLQHVFNCLPLAALVGKRIFCAHGGISDSLITFKQFDRIVRPADVADVGLMVDLLWSDPSSKTEWYQPSHRGASSVFGSRAISTFSQNLGVDLIVRAHQCVDEGYEMFGAKTLIIFSAPAYTDNNAAAVLKIDTDLTCQVLTYRKQDEKAKIPTTSPPPVSTSPARP
ncbi:hypothetical protein PMAYCL1PPCAC_02948, partial [Pristionchus mayeri]